MSQRKRTDSETESALRKERGDLLTEIVRRIAFKRGLPKNRVHHYLARDVWAMAEARSGALAAGRTPPRVDVDISGLLVRYVELDEMIEKARGDTV